MTGISHLTLLRQEVFMKQAKVGMKNRVKDCRCGSSSRTTTKKEVIQQRAEVMWRRVIKLYLKKRNIVCTYE
jgi:hypothetical protein